MSNVNPSGEGHHLPVQSRIELTRGRVSGSKQNANAKECGKPAEGQSQHSSGDAE